MSTYDVYERALHNSMFDYVTLRYIRRRYNEFALPSLALLHRDVFSQYSKEHPATLPAEVMRERLTSLPGSAAYEDMRGEQHHNDTHIGSYEELGAMAAPPLHAQHSLVSMSEDWPSLERVCTADFDGNLSLNMSYEHEQS